MRKQYLKEILAHHSYTIETTHYITIVRDKHGRKVATIDEMVANDIHFFQMPENIVLDTLIMYTKAQPFER